MKEIVVVSGKGGTGKTSITAALAVLAGNSAIVSDCDVDAANMHLLLQPDFASKTEFYSGVLAEINQDTCIQCGICANTCRFNAIPLVNNQYKIDPLACEGCGYCQKVCPQKAITLHERKSGQVFTSTTKVGSTMVHAKLDIGAENSGKLVAKVKSNSQQLAKEQNKEFIIVDGSPGIGCPVVSSLSGANYVVLVTEPTVSGLHDLERIYSVVKRFRLKAGCIINKHDINPEKTKEIIQFLDAEKITHLANIPYETQFVDAMTNAKTIVEVESQAKNIIKETWEKIKHDISKN